MFPSQDPEYLKKIAKLHAWPGEAFDDLYDNKDPEELIDEEPRTDWLIKPKGKKANGNRSKENRKN